MKTKPVTPAVTKDMVELASSIEMRVAGLIGVATLVEKVAEALDAGEFEGTVATGVEVLAGLVGRELTDIWTSAGNLHMDLERAVEASETSGEA